MAFRRLGAFYQSYKSEGSQTLAYKCFVEGRKIRNLIFHFYVVFLSKIFAPANDGQYDCTFLLTNLPKKNWDYLRFTGIIITAYCRIPSWVAKQGCRLSIRSSEWPKQVEAKSKDIWDDFQGIRDYRYRSFCFLGFPLGSNLHVLAIGFIQKRQDVFQTSWIYMTGYVFPPFF